MILWLAILGLTAFVTLRLIGGRRKVLHRQVMVDFVEEAPQFMQAERQRIAAGLDAEIDQGLMAEVPAAAPADQAAELRRAA